MARQQKGPALRELKSRVFRLAGVCSTRALKGLAPPFKKLDFRCKSAWLQAEAALKASNGGFEQWLAQPPEEYRELFAEINMAVADFRTGIDQGLKLSHELMTMAGKLEEEALQQQDREARERLN